MTIQNIEKYVVALFLLTLGIHSTPMLFKLPLELNQIISLMFVMLFFLNLKNNITIIKRLSIYVILLFFYLISFMTLSYLFSFNFVENIPINISSRYIVQVLSLLAQFATGFYLFKIMINDYKNFYKFIFIGFYVVIFFALIQIFLLAIGMTGWSILMEDNTYRINSISGEPKMFAAYILPFLIYGIYSYSKKNNLTLVVTLFSFLKSFSTSSFIVFFISLFVLFKKYIITKKGFLLFVVFIIIFQIPIIHERFLERIFMLFTPELYLDPLKTMVNLPIINIPLLVDPTEASSLELIFNNPWILLSGVGYGMESIYSYLYFNSDTAGFYGTDYNGVLSPNNAMLRNILYFGFPLYLYMVTRFNNISLKNIQSNNKIIVFYSIFLFVSGISNFFIFGNKLFVIPLLFMAEALKFKIRNKDL